MHIDKVTKIILHSFNSNHRQRKFMLFICDILDSLQPFMCLFIFKFCSRIALLNCTISEERKQYMQHFKYILAVKPEMASPQLLTGT